MKAMNIQRILIPMDFSETAILALKQGAFMARLFKAEFFMLHVIETMEFAYSIYDPAMAIPLESDEIEDNVFLSLNEQAKKTEAEYGLQVKTLIRRGRVATEISDAADENNIDLIVMGTHGAKGFQEFFIGSNAHKTVTIAPCPVLTIQKDSETPGFSTILMPIDNTLHSRQKVNSVVQLATHYGSHVHVLGLIEEGEEDGRSKFMIKIEAVEKALEKAKVGYTLEIVVGENLAEETMKYAEKVKADLIVIMTDHESRFTGIFLGAFAKQIINHSQIPVLSIRPLEGHFESIDLSASSNPYNG